MNMNLFIVLFYTHHTLILTDASVWSGEKTRIRVLRTEEEKRKYLNESRLAKENFFFGMRPILYVSRYCNCPNDPAVTNVQPGSASSGSIIQDHLEPPEFPPEEFDEIIPPASDAQILTPSSRVTESPTNSPAPSSQLDKEDEEEEFELLISHPRGEQHVIDAHHFRSFDQFGRPVIMAIRSRPFSSAGGKRKKIRRRFNSQQPFQQMNQRAIRIPISNVPGGPTVFGPPVML